MIELLIGIAIGTIFSPFVKKLFDICLKKLNGVADEMAAEDDTPTE